MTRKTRTPGMKKAKLPNPLLHGKKMPTLLEYISKENDIDPLIASGKVRPFIMVLEQSEDLSPLVIAALRLNSKNKTMRRNAAKLLKVAVAEGIDMTPVFSHVFGMPIAIRGLYEIERETFNFLASLVSEKRTRVYALPALLRSLAYGNELFKENMVKILLDSISKESEDKSRSIVYDIVDFTRSEGFQREMQRNSSVYVKTMEGLAHILGQCKDWQERYSDERE